MPAEWDAATYDQVSNPQARWGGAVASWLELSGSEVVLDAGCGTGRVTEAVLARLPHGEVIGMDGSPAMVAQARHRLGPYAARLRLLVADLDHPLPIAARSLDAVISTATFHWVADHDALFTNLAGAIRPGGQLVAQCGGHGNIASVVRALAAVAPGEGYPWTYATPQETEQRLQRAGFTDTETWLTPEPTRYESREELERFMATVILWPQLRRRDPSQHAAFVKEVAGRLPGLELDYVRLNLRARRQGHQQGHPAGWPAS
jgi:trans-aconitate 2-methyltransferase